MNKKYEKLFKEIEKGVRKEFVSKRKYFLEELKELENFILMGVHLKLQRFQKDEGSKLITNSKRTKEESK